jgi:hypothetical protein
LEIASVVNRCAPVICSAECRLHYRAVHQSSCLSTCQILTPPQRTVSKAY